MSDVKKTYDEIIDFMNNEIEKTLLLRGIADKDVNVNEFLSQVLMNF